MAAGGRLNQGERVFTDQGASKPRVVLKGNIQQLKASEILKTVMMGNKTIKLEERELWLAKGGDHGGNQTGSEGEWFLSIIWPQARSGAHLFPPCCGLLGARVIPVANVATKGPWSVLHPEATWMTMDRTASKSLLVRMDHTASEAIVMSAWGCC